MTVLPIRVFPDPILRRRSRAILRVDEEIITLAKDMLETLKHAEGVGLAAPQVGVLKRLIAIRIPESAPFAMANPEILHKFGEREVSEGCLSVPGYTGIVKRSLKIEARALDMAGGRLQLSAEELLAQAIEHEVDHLNGILFLDHLKAHEDVEKTGVSHHEPHWHDVGYDVYAFKNPPRFKDVETAEKLRSIAKLSQLSGESSLSEARYDLESVGDAESHSENLDETSP